MKIPTAILTAGLSAALVVPAAAAAAEAKTIPVKYPATHVKITKTGPATRAVPHVTKRGVEPRQLCICVSWQIDWAKLQAQADFEAAFNDRMLLRGLESWQWLDDQAAVDAFSSGMAAVLAGAGTIDQILAAIEASW